MKNLLIVYMTNKNIAKFLDSYDIYLCIDKDLQNIIDIILKNIKKSDLKLINFFKNNNIYLSNNQLEIVFLIEMNLYVFDLFLQLSNLLNIDFENLKHIEDNKLHLVILILNSYILERFTILRYDNSYDFFDFSTLLEKCINNNIKKQDIDEIKREINLNIINFLHKVNIIDDKDLLKNIII